MKFTKSYEPGEFEPQIYAEWEKMGVFQPREVVAEANESENYKYQGSKLIKEQWTKPILLL